MGDDSGGADDRSGAGYGSTDDAGTSYSSTS
jgi:hypothetical protein